METFSVSLALCEGKPPVTCGFPSQRQVIRSFDVFFDLRLNKRSSKQLRPQWFETPSLSLWRQYNGVEIFMSIQGIYHNLVQHVSYDLVNNASRNTSETHHYSDVIMSAMASQITGVSIVYSTVCSGAENIKVSRHWPSWGKFTAERWFPARSGSNGENVSNWWRHRDPERRNIITIEVPLRHRLNKSR